MGEMIVMLIGGGLSWIVWFLRILSIYIFIDSKKYKNSHGVLWALANFLVPGITFVAYILRFKIKKRMN